MKKSILLIVAIVAMAPAFSQVTKLQLTDSLAKGRTKSIADSTMWAKRFVALETRVTAAEKRATAAEARLAALEKPDSMFFDKYHVVVNSVVTLKIDSILKPAMQRIDSSAIAIKGIYNYAYSNFILANNSISGLAARVLKLENLPQPVPFDPTSLNVRLSSLEGWRTLTITDINLLKAYDDKLRTTPIILPQ